MIHGLVDRPLILTMDDIMRFPSVSRIHFIECPANGGMEWRESPAQFTCRASIASSGTPDGQA